MSAFLAPPIGATDQKLAVSSSVVTLTALPTTASHAMLQFQGASIMVTFDGSDPSATNGFEYAPGTAAEWSNKLCSVARFIRKGTTDGAVFCQPAILS